MVIGTATSSFGAATLAFVAPGPQDAKVGTPITTTDFGGGNLIQVQVTGSGSQNARITVDIDIANSPDPEPGASLSGLKTVRASGGIATFNVSITKHGTYQLVATATSMGPGHSAAFRIWDNVCGEGSPCPIGQIKKGSPVGEENMTAQVTSTSGLVALSLGDDSINCSDVEAAHGVTFNHIPSTVTLFASDPGTEKTGYITVSRDWDTNFGDPPGAAHYQVCYIDDLQPWTDLFGEPRAVGEASFLNDCSPSVDAPCVVSRTKENRSRNVSIVVRLRDLKMH